MYQKNARQLKFTLVPPDPIKFIQVHHPQIATGIAVCHKSSSTVAHDLMQGLIPSMSAHALQASSGDDVSDIHDCLTRFTHAGRLNGSAANDFFPLQSLSWCLGKSKNAMCIAYIEGGSLRAWRMECSEVMFPSCAAHPLFDKTHQLPTMEFPHRGSQVFPIILRSSKDVVCVLKKLTILINRQFNNETWAVLEIMCHRFKNWLVYRCV